MATIFEKARLRRDNEGASMERGAPADQPASAPAAASGGPGFFKDEPVPAGMTRAEFEKKKKEALAKALREAASADSNSPNFDPMAVARKNAKRVPYVVPR